MKNLAEFIKENLSENFNSLEKPEVSTWVETCIDNIGKYEFKNDTLYLHTVFRQGDTIIKSEQGFPSEIIKKIVVLGNHGLTFDYDNISNEFLQLFDFEQGEISVGLTGSIKGGILKNINWVGLSDILIAPRSSLKFKNCHISFNRKCKYGTPATPLMFKGNHFVDETMFDGLTISTINTDPHHNLFEIYIYDTPACGYILKYKNTIKKGQAIKDSLSNFVAEMDAKTNIRVKYSYRNSFYRNGESGEWEDERY